MGYFGIPFRNGVPIGLGSVASFGAQQFDPSSLFIGGTVGTFYDPSDPTTLFTTSTGTTPCAVPGSGSQVLVGLMLDKSQGAPGALGAELFGTFGTVTAPWTAQGGGVWSIDGSQAGSRDLSQALQYTIGRFYVTRFTLSGVTGGSVNVFAGEGAVGPAYGNGTFTIRSYSSQAYLIFRAPAGVAATVSGISVREIPGNHAIAFNDTTARPELRARVNLLTYSEDQSNGVWINYSATQQSNVGTAPDGTNTADRIVEASGFSLQARYQTLAGGLNISHTVSAYAKADQRNVFNLSYSGVGGTNWFAATFELIGNGSVTKTGAGAAGTYTSSSITPVGNGWYFCTVTGNPGQASTHYAYGGPSDTNNPTYGNFGVLTYSGNTANGVLVWGFDVRPANIGANVPAYQRIADANTYDTSGFPLYLRFDGIDDSMYTPANLDLSGTDKVAVFAGVRKFNNTTQQFIVETSTNSFINNGAFSLLTNTNNAGGTVAGAYGGTFRGTSGAGYGATGTTAPISNVVTAIGNIAAATDASILRVNGTQVATSGATSAGTGNFGTYRMYIASRLGVAPNLLEGHLHSLIIAGSAVSAGNISATEQWVANKTGIVIP